MAELKLPHEWAPRTYQRDAWKYLSDGGKRLVLRWHRRSGKDDLGLHHTCCAAHQRVGNYWYMLPQAEQARKSMWTAINPHSGKRRIDEAFPHEIRRRTLEQEMVIEFHCGSTFQLVGSDNFNSLVGSPPVGLVFSEYALSNPSAWSYLMPILEENGGWVIFNSTPRGDNHFKGMCSLASKEPGWMLDVRTADDTEIFSKKQLESILRQMQEQHGEAYGRSLWLQEYFVSFDAAIPGSIFAEWLDRAKRAGRIVDFEADPSELMHTAWDLGRTDATAIWFFKVVNGEILVCDYHESALKDIPYYVALLLGTPDAADSVQDAALKRRLKGVKYGTHWLPHDARARTLAAGGKSIQQQMIDSDVGRIAIAKRLDHNDGIQAARATLPHCRFHATRCAQGLNVLRHYHYEWDDEKKRFSDMPMHDWASHGASAFRTLSLSWRVPKDAPKDAPIMERMMAMNPSAYSFGRLKDEHFRRMRARRAEMN